MSVLSKAIISICFDDGGATVYTEGFSYMQSLGIPGSVGINSNKHGAASGWLTVPQMQEMAAAGWSMTNHTHAHLDHTLLTVEQAVEQYTLTRDYLISHNLPEGAEHVWFPSNRRTEENSAAIVAIGAKSFPSGQFNLFAGEPCPDRYMFKRCSRDSEAMDVATFQSRVDSAIANKFFLHVYFHHIEAPEHGTQSVGRTEFRAMMDYVKLKMDEGSCETKNHVDCFNEYMINSRLKITTS